MATAGVKGLALGGVEQKRIPSLLARIIGHGHNWYQSLCVRR